LPLAPASLFGQAANGSCQVFVSQLRTKAARRACHRRVFIVLTVVDRSLIQMGAEVRRIISLAGHLTSPCSCSAVGRTLSRMASRKTRSNWHVYNNHQPRCFYLPFERDLNAKAAVLQCTCWRGICSCVYSAPFPNSTTLQRDSLHLRWDVIPFANAKTENLGLHPLQNFEIRTWHDFKGSKGRGEGSLYPYVRTPNKIENMDTLL
jgi:hypothetical protein